MCYSPITVNGKPKYINKQWVTQHPVSCGKCPKCKKDRVSSWVFRLMEEEKRSLSSSFITLTYNTENVPLTKNGYMTLDKKDITKFIKRLRKNDNKSWKSHNLQQHLKKPLKYYLAGEYGTIRSRPHYHIILLNLYDFQNIDKSWNNGKERGAIHVGNSNCNSIAYTMKYIDKNKKIPQHRNDDRIREFANMSQDIGSNYLTDAMKKYHTDDLSRYYVTNGHYKIKMPRYYSKQIYTEKQLQKISKIIHDHYEEKEIKLAKRCQRIYKGSMSLDEYKACLREAEYTNFYKQQKIRDV